VEVWAQSYVAKDLGSYKKKISFLPKRAAFAMQRIEGRKEGKG
jgi:hypothetical protein